MLEFIRWARPALLMMVGPPLLWSILLWLDPVAMGLRGPAVVYSLAALAVAPGIIGLGMLPLGWRIKGLILPCYLAGMAFVFLYSFLIVVCVVTHDCP